MRGSLTTRLCLLTGALVVIGMMIHAFGAATIDHATITEVVHDVSILDPNSRKASPAEVSGVFEVPQIMKTGGDSRSEMISTDRTITRVGADTLFSFEPRSRTINLQEGSLLFQSQPGNGGGTIRTAAVTAAVLGTTIIVAATKDGGFKLLVLEGTGYVRMPNGKHATVHAGQMIFVPPGGETLGPVLEFRLLDEVATSDLVMGFKTRLPSWRKIAAASDAAAAAAYLHYDHHHGNTAQAAARGRRQPAAQRRSVSRVLKNFREINLADR
jgi:hypothetical protein